MPLWPDKEKYVLEMMNSDVSPLFLIELYYLYLDFDHPLFHAWILNIDIALPKHCWKWWGCEYRCNWNKELLVIATLINFWGTWISFLFMNIAALFISYTTQGKQPLFSLEISSIQWALKFQISLPEKKQWWFWAKNITLMIASSLVEFMMGP